VTIKRLAVNKLYGFLPTTHSSLPGHPICGGAPIVACFNQCTCQKHRGAVGWWGKGDQIRWSKTFTKLVNKNAIKPIKGKIPRELTKTSMTLPPDFQTMCFYGQKSNSWFLFWKPLSYSSFKIIYNLLAHLPKSS
jgi:hypothetical protein